MSVRERLLEATYACGARYGLAKTTVEDVAREARLSRATVYRYFPGGKDQLLRETISWEVSRFLERLTAAVAGAGSFEELLEEALVFSHRAIEEHEVLQKLLQTEPERLLPQLSLDASRVLAFIGEFVAPALPANRLPPGVSLQQAADYVARMLLSFISSQGRWDLRDRAQVRELVRSELLAFLRPETGGPAEHR